MPSKRQPLAIHTLDNGLRFVHLPSPPDRSPGLALFIGAGPRYETEASKGISHFLEHVLFLGAGSRDPRRLRHLQAELGGPPHAETSLETMVFTGQVDSSSGFRRLAGVVSDLIVRPWLPEGPEIEWERGAVIQEILGAGDPVDDAFELGRSALWPDQPQGWPVMGTVDSVARFTAADCRSFRSRCFTPANALVVFRGGRAEREAVERQLGREEWPAAPSPDAATSRLGPGGAVVAHETTGEFVRLCLAFPTPAIDTAGRDATRLASYLIGEREDSYLWDEVRGRGYSYFVESGTDYTRDSGWLGLYADVHASRAGELTARILGDLPRIAEALTDDRVRRAQKRMAAQWRGGPDEEMWEMRDHAQELWLTGEVPDAAPVSRWQRLEPGAVRRAAQATLRPDRACAGVIGSCQAIDAVRVAMAAVGPAGNPP